MFVTSLFQLNAIHSLFENFMLLRIEYRGGILALKQMSF